MSLISVRREYYREEPGSVEAKVIGCAGFDAVAPIALFIHADSKFEKEAIASLKELKKQCGHIPEINELSTMELKKGDTPGVDFAHIYNRQYEQIATGFGNAIAVDTYGAWGNIDLQANGHWGDSQGFFPFYMDEETLKKDIEEWNGG
jgi:hypothetical protein